MNYENRLGDKMIVLVKASVLTIDIKKKNKILQQLPIELVTMQSCIEAARYLKTEKVDSVISKWDYQDMEKERFLKSLKAIKPHISTIVLIESGDPKLEIAARSLGASAVLTEDSDDEHFLQTVIAVLGLRNVILTKVHVPTKRKHAGTKNKL
jgi:DNA-binding NarL/FixJ family response regulator